MIGNVGVEKNLEYLLTARGLGSFAIILALILNKLRLTEACRLRLLQSEIPLVSCLDFQVRGQMLGAKKSLERI